MTQEKDKPNFIQNFFDKRLCNKIANRFNMLDKNMWLSYGHTFNRWQFPEDFYDLMPRWYRKGNRGRLNTNRYMTIYRTAAKLVDSHFTNKEQLRYHNVIMGKMSEGEFEYWYENISRINVTDQVINKFYARRDKINEIEWWKDEVFEKIINVFPELKNNNQK